MPLLRSRTLSLGIALFVMAAALVGLAQEQPTDKGELKIEGTHISRLVLERQDKHVEQWTNLEGSIKIPAGTYQVRQIELEGNYSYSSGLGPIVVSPNEPAVLKAGGPLRQGVRVERQGSLLVLNYELAGVGDEKYRPVPTTQGPASFAVYKGDKVVASGKFEYG